MPRNDLITGISYIGKRYTTSQKNGRSRTFVALTLSAERCSEFTLGEYSAQRGTDAIIEFIDKGVPRTGWLELVHQLPNLFAWNHNLERIQKIVCWELGDIKASYELEDGTKVRYEKSGRKHVLLHDTSSIPVYVLSELLKVPEAEEE